MFTATKDNVANDLKSGANNLKNEARDTAYQVTDDLRDVANRTGRKVRGLIDTASDEISHATESVSTQIRTNPVQSSLIALGAGFILGALLRR